MSMTLHEYRAALGVTADKFAAMLGQGTGTVHSWMAGLNRRPKLATALAIWLETDGHVDPTTWVQVGDAKDGGRVTESNPPWWTEEHIAALRKLLKHKAPLPAAPREVGIRSLEHELYRRPCPECRAAPGRRCRHTGIRNPRRKGQEVTVPHLARQKAARRAAAAGRGGIDR